MQRVMIPELLDTDSGTSAEIAASLVDLRNINRWFGGVGTTRWMLRRVANRLGVSSLSMLEVAAGSSHVPEACRQSLGRSGLKLDVTLLDRAPSHLQNGARAVAADARALPFQDSSFDVVSSTLFAHHLAPQDLIVFFREARRVCRRAVLINDLIRHPLHLALVYAGLPLFRSRLTWHDAPASVRQAYTPEEIRSSLAQSAVGQVEIYRRYLFRMGVIAWKN
jgi:ubiquinone/menaquinone biosynthesis C-methylase UbiE